MNPYATKLSEAFSAKLMKQVYARALTPFITNNDYQGDVQQGSLVNIPALTRISERTYVPAGLGAPDDLNEIVAVLNVDQLRSFYFRVRTIDEYRSFIKDPRNKTIEQRANERKRNIDSFVLNFWDDVAAGNRLGVDTTAGTVAVDANGTVTGVGTAFTAAMVGRGFRATGHTRWFRVRTFASATSITIEEDRDDTVNSYTGGVIAAGATYVIEATTPVVLTSATIMNRLLRLKTILDEHEVPDEGRWLVVPPIIANLIPEGTNISIAVPSAYEELVKKGFITEIVGFKVFSSPRVVGNNTTGFRCLAGTSDWLTFADNNLENGIEEDLIGNFGSAFKDLYVYGAKVADERRRFACELFARV